ncbi:alpha/beta-hydrolase [Zopfia rhizophila CBS 207.26]|uniref:Alpha/beta-hydrolase n=1 Tax=Zopfia rhizophila CBS 207.26 TaxID=1314779 RepID=A0A6A6EEP0_9PEZI|nr:alpha/beta-hydrolase [Zopfia rhizophila CBS 207.26]
MSYPPPYVVEPQPGHAHSHTIILLHGRSSTAKEFASDLLSLKTSSPTQNLLSSFPRFRWVFPNAGDRWCTAFKEKRFAWCDTFSLDNLSERQDLQVAGLRDGIQLIKRTVEDEAERLGGSSRRIILGGFSQGGATALWSLFSGAATAKGKLGAFVGLSAWMPFTKEAIEVVIANGSDISPDLRVKNLATTFLDIIGLEAFTSEGMALEHIQGTRIFLGHGTDDALISVKNCHDLSAILRSLEAVLEVHEYVGADREGHWVKEPEQVDDIVGFLNMQPEKDESGASNR